MDVPASQAPHEATDTDWVTAENRPGGHPVQWGRAPSLYVPAEQAVQLELQSGQRAPLWSLHVVPHDTHTDAPAADPVYGGQAWHAVLPVKYANVPAEHSVQLPNPYDPGAQVWAKEIGRKSRSKASIETPRGRGFIQQCC
jgi:hypothetical protein